LNVFGKVNTFEYFEKEAFKYRNCCVRSLILCHCS